MAERIVVLGIDPGTLVTGFGAVAREGGRMRAVLWGRIATSPRVSLSERLMKIHAEVARQIEACRPDEVAVERVFQAKNVESSLKLGHARGVALLAVAEAGLSVFEYAAREVKQSVVGTGSASKAQVSSMVKRLLGMSSEDVGEDESDAMAVAICHLHKRGAG